MRPLGALASVALSACSPAGQLADGDRSGALFDPDHIVEVDLGLDAQDWSSLRAQTRSWVDVHESCLQRPFDSPYSYFPAHLSIDGQRVDRVGVRKRGFLGSLSDDKPSLKIAFGDRSLLLNNGVQDPSYVRQCLAFGIFAAAGLPAPRCNFARVRVNGEDLGLYVHVDDIDQQFLARHFAAPHGKLYEGTYSDFRSGWTATFEAENGPRADDRRELHALVAALERPDGDLVDAMASLVDVDQLLTFWAIEVLVTHRDGYAGNANNYFAYLDPADDRFRFIPWGADKTFLPGPDPLDNGMLAVTAGSLAPWRLLRLPDVRARYVGRLRALLDQVWDESALLAQIDHAQELITPVADADGSLGLAGHLDEVRDVIRARRAAIVGELDQAPAWDPRLGEPPCLEVIGDLSGGVTTHWGTADDDAFASGDGTFSAVVDGMPLGVTAVGATAGTDPADPASARIVAVAALSDGTAAMLVFQLAAAELRAGAQLPIDAVDTFATLYRYAPSTGTLLAVGTVTEGMIWLDDAAAIDGAPLQVRFRGRLTRSPTPD